MNNDLISRSELRKEVERIFCVGSYHKDRIIYLINNAPTVDAVVNTIEVRPQGEWVKIGDIGLAYTCNKCGEVNVIPTNFCPNCGAKMKGGAE